MKDHIAFMNFQQLLMTALGLNKNRLINSQTSLEDLGDLPLTVR